MKYVLKSGAASYEGTDMGGKEFVYPATRKGVENALKEALIDLANKAQQAEIIQELREEVAWCRSQ